MVEDLQKERKKLNLLLIKQKNFSKIKLFKISSDFNKKITEITEDSNKIKKKEVNNTLVYEQRQLLIHQQKVSLKKQLAKLDAEYNKLKLSLEKEVILLKFFLKSRVEKNFFFLLAQRKTHQRARAPAKNEKRKESQLSQAVQCRKAV